MSIAPTLALEPQSGVQSIEPGLLRSLNLCLHSLEYNQRYYGGRLPTVFQVLDRIKLWPAAQGARDFVAQLVSELGVGEDDVQVVAHLLESAAVQGNAAAREALDRLEIAIANANEPARWVEVIVMDAMAKAVDEFNAKRTQAQVRWFGESDTDVQHQVVLPLIYWGTGDTGNGPMRALGSVCEEDEPAMQERLQTLLDLGMRGGMVGAASPVVQRPDGRHSFFALLVPIRLV